jgi:hypothetical protein
MDFVKEVMERFPNKATPLVVFCDASRPTMEKAMGRDFGIRSRSLQAIYYLTKVGGTNTNTQMRFDPFIYRQGNVVHYVGGDVAA